MTREKAMEILRLLLGESPHLIDGDRRVAIQFALDDMKVAQLREQQGQS